MKSKDFLEAIDQYDPCRDAVRWAEDKKTLSEIWRTCDRGDWLLWAAAKVGIDRKIIVAAACDCAELALKYVPKGEDRPREAIETARKWIKGEATLKEVRNASAAAAYAAAADAYAAAYAAAAAAAYAAADSVLLASVKIALDAYKAEA